MNDFFNNSEADSLDAMVLKQLEHIYGNWELTWDYEEDKYLEEDDSYAALLNELIEELGSVSPPEKYHDNEDRLAEYVKNSLNWGIRKVGNRWEGDDYISILEQGGFQDVDEKELVLATSGRIRAAQERGQVHFDDMEKSHKKILADVLAVILYHRSDRVKASNA